MATTDELESLVLSRDQAKILAEKYRPGHSKALPKKLAEIPNSLLAAEHIDEFVKDTGLIAPYYSGGGRKSRLKKASYEGRIGKRAFIYKDDSSPQQIFDYEKNTHLKIPKNSIVFVESDLDFRLPEFIALRFNLQIRHVHRGLLLGTGPLIDPGYWGKLCIPLHNLTNEDYLIPRDEGIIWLEFTKTTSPKSASKSPIGRPPLGIDHDGFFDIVDFLEKASEIYGFGKDRSKVPISSSLPYLIEKSERAVEESAKNAANAATDAKKFTRLSYLSVLGGLIGLIGLVYVVASLQWTYVDKVEKLEKEITELRKEVESLKPK